MLQLTRAYILAISVFRRIQRIECTEVIKGEHNTADKFLQEDIE